MILVVIAVASAVAYTPAGPVATPRSGAIHHPECMSLGPHPRDFGHAIKALGTPEFTGKRVNFTRIRP